MFEVESIVDHRVFHDKEEYLVKWKDYPAEENTWETKEELRKTAPDIISEFEMNWAQRMAEKGPEDYIVEGYVAKRVKNKKLEYKVKWEGWCAEYYCTWEPAKNLQHIKNLKKIRKRKCGCRCLRVNGNKNEVIQRAQELGALNFTGMCQG